MCFHCCFVTSLPQVRGGLNAHKLIKPSTYLICLSRAKSLSFSSFLLICIYCFSFTSLSIDQVDCRVIRILLSFVFGSPYDCLMDNHATSHFFYVIIIKSDSEVGNYNDSVRLTSQAIYTLLLKI